MSVVYILSHVTIGSLICADELSKSQQKTKVEDCSPATQPGSQKIVEGCIEGPALQDLEASILTTPAEFGTSFSSTSTAGITAHSADFVPEQKIFPGIVHERAHRNNMPIEGIVEDDKEEGSGDSETNSNSTG